MIRPLLCPATSLSPKRAPLLEARFFFFTSCPFASAPTPDDFLALSALSLGSPSGYVSPTFLSFKSFCLAGARSGQFIFFRRTSGLISTGGLCATRSAAFRSPFPRFLVFFSPIFEHSQVGSTRFHACSASTSVPKEKPVEPAAIAYLAASSARIGQPPSPFSPPPPYPNPLNPSDATRSTSSSSFSNTCLTPPYLPTGIRTTLSSTRPSLSLSPALCIYTPPAVAPHTLPNL